MSFNKPQFCFILACPNTPFYNKVKIRLQEVEVSGRKSSDYSCQPDKSTVNIEICS